MTTNLDISMSLDGYVAGPDRTRDEPLGAGGERLHDWAMGDDPAGQQILADAGAHGGAVICGRRTYDDSIRWWGPDGPTGPARLPVFVLTHTPPDDTPDDGVYRFVTDGIDAALEQATTAADGKNVSVMGGADVARQYIDAGLIDEVSIHLVPVLLGDGLRLFKPGGKTMGLEPTGVVDTATATHLRYRVAN